MGVEIEERKKEKLVTATKKGSAVLDQYISDQVKSQYHVLQQVKECKFSTLSMMLHLQFFTNGVSNANAG